MQPFRFIHASRVQLDSPVILPGECIPADRQLAEDATILAFRTLVEACIERDADLLLLTGDTFGASLITLREQMELEQGLAKLSDHNVAVVIAPGNEDPAGAWREHIQLPDGVDIACAAQNSPIHIQRNGQDVAAVFSVAVVDDAGKPHGCRLPQLGSNLCRIGLVGAGSADFESLQEIADEASAGTIHIQRDSHIVNSPNAAVEDAIHRVDYLAVGLAGQRQTHSVGSATLHNPGPLQSLDATITGACGASFVSVGQDGRASIEHLPMAAIRWERLHISAHAANSIEDLAIEMEQELRALAPAANEKLWIIQWRLDCSARLSDDLHRTSLSDLWDLIDAGSHSRPTCRHILQTLRAAHGDEAELAGGRSDDEDTEDNLRTELQRLVEHVSHSEWGRTTWGRRVARELSKLSPAQIHTRVRETVAGAMRQAGNS